MNCSMKYLLLIVICALISNTGISQDTLNAKYAGGTEELLDFIGKTVRYPMKAKENGMQGIVLVSFRITVTGNIDSVQVVRSVDKVLNEEAARVIKLMSKWTAAEFNGNKVSQIHTLPVRFVLVGEKNFYELGKSAYQEGNYKKAVKLLDRSVTITPKNSGALFYKGRSLVYLGEKETGHKIIKEAANLGDFEAKAYLDKN